MSYADTEFNRRQRLVQRIKDLFGTARHLQMTHGWIEGELQSLREKDDWKRAPRPTREYCHGMIDALRDEIWRMVRFVYITPRGPVSVDSRDKPGLTSEELHVADTFERGHAWSVSPLKWFTTPGRFPNG